MKIDVVYFLPEVTNSAPDGRMIGRVAGWLTTDEEIVKRHTARFFARHPLKLGANAVFFVVPEVETSRYTAAWMTFKDVLPPANVITTREADQYEESLLSMSEAYWHEFTRLEPKFAVNVGPMFCESPVQFDELFQKAPKPLAKNFKRDLTIILHWKNWQADWSMKLTNISAELKKMGFDVTPDLLGEIRKKYELPSLS